MNRRLLWSAVLLLLTPALGLADVAPPPPELPVVGVEASPLSVVVAGVALSVAIGLLGLVITRWWPVKVVAPTVVVAVLVCIGITALCAGWAQSKMRKRGGGGHIQRYPIRRAPPDLERENVASDAASPDAEPADGPSIESNAAGQAEPDTPVDDQPTPTR